MNLVYKSSKKEVKVGDVIPKDGEFMKVLFFRVPHKPSSEGKVTVRLGSSDREFYVGVIGAEWINREDR